VDGWLHSLKVSNGPLLRSVNRHGHVASRRLSAKAIGLVVKRSVRALGLDPDQFGGHSLRAGFATEAARVGVSERRIMRQTGHRNVATVRRYIRDGELFIDDPIVRLGL
jgi:integrase